MKTQKVTHQPYLPSNSKSKLVIRRTRKRFNPRIFIERTIETTAISLTAWLRLPPLYS